MTLKSGVGSVQFYPDKPLLETELNELQSVQNEAREDIIRDSIPSGFTQLGELDFDYMLNNENKVKLKSDSVAFVNGMRIFIPKDTIIDIGKAPEKESREDLLFLEVWKEEVGADGALTQYGGEGQASITNHILDSRVGSETSKRVINRWRIRHIADIDFKTFPEGIGIDETTWNRIAWLKYPSAIAPQGGNTEVPELLPRYRYKYMFGKMMGKVNKFDISEFRNFPNVDLGLYTSGNGDSTSKEYLKTIDGYVYAIPMFKLYRKPSCGKSIPFEYDKINPKVDYSKFAKLVQDEKVERVHAENIKGRSLVNLVNFNEFGSLLYGYDPISNILTLPSIDGTDWLSHKNRLILKPSTKYSLIVKALDTNILYEIQYCKTQTVNLVRSGNISVLGITTILFDSPESFDIISLKLMDSSGKTSGKRVHLMVLEGDWTNKVLPEFFTGLKSLGEDEGNLVTVKNGVLNDNTYDPCDGNQKLNTFPNVTHVMCENTIIPEFTAEVKKDGAKQSDVTAFGKLTTEGVEQIEFTKIKGKTLQNLSHVRDFDCGNAPSSNTSPLLKPNTTYTFITRITNVANSPSGVWFRITFKDSTYYDVADKQYTEGFHKIVFTIPNKEINYYNIGWIRNYAEGQTASMKDIVILEGDYSNVDISDIPYIEGIKSVGENESNQVLLRTNGINLFSIRDITDPNITKYETGYLVTSGNRKVKIDRRLQKGTTYTLSFKETVRSGSLLTKVMYGDSTTLTRYISVQTDSLMGRKYVTITPEIDNCYLYTYIDAGSTASVELSEVCLVEGRSTNYISSTFNQDIYLKEPLRSLPNGVCDEIVGNKVIRRVGKFILNGSESWRTSAVANQTNETAFAIDGYLSNINCKIPSTNTILPNLLCDTLPRREDMYNGTNGECIVFAPPSNVFIRVANSKLSTLDISGLKTWLSQNPTTVYYELANPVEEYLEHVYEKESIKTYQLDAPLRSLPNGVKDEIKDGVLIRRCAEIVYNGVESWSLAQDHKDNYAIFNRVHPTNFYATSDKTVLPDKIINKYVWDNAYNEEGLWFDGNGHVYICIAKSKLESIDISGFKKYLQSNPIKVIYQCFHYETILTEAKPQTADFSLQRQFGEGNWLRELPNGVKDTVENGKVIRRVGKLVIDSSVVFTTHSNTEDYYEYRATVAGLPTITVLTSYSNNFPQTENHRIVNSDVVYVRFPVSMGITTPELCNQWFLNNKTVLLYQLANTIEEVLSTDNYMPYPCHEINTYCGSMYVGQGRNHVVNENKMPSEDVVIVDTPFRSIEGQSKVEDCRYKKQADGYNTKYLSSGSNNLVNIKNVNPNGCVYSYISGGIKVKNEDVGTYKCILIEIGKLKPNTRYKVKFDKSVKYGTAYVAVKYGSGTSLGESSSPFTITTPSSFDIIYRLQVYCTTNTSTLGEVDYTNIMLVEEGNSEIFVDYTPCDKYFENTESNDIEDLRHQVSLTGFNFDSLLNKSFDLLLRGEL